MCKFVDASANSKVKILDVFRLNAKDKADVNKFSSCSLVLIILVKQHYRILL